MAPRFDDLFVFDTGLCHLRVYDGPGGESVALALQLDDNPGPSVVTAADVLAGRVATMFGGRPRLFVIFSGVGETWIEVLHGARAGADDRFRECVSHAEVERLVGEAIALPAEEECTAAGLGGPNHPLLTLISTEPEPGGRLDAMGIVSVADLPWAHNPFKCAHRDRFEEIRGLYDKSPGGKLPAGAHFFSSLSADEFAACSYHKRDWIAIAAASLELLQGLRPGSDLRDVLGAAANLLPDGPDRQQLVCLFSDPIKFSPRAIRLTNGQHRACALKAAGAPLCVAHVYRERG